ncbi:MAG: hypothetical protein LBE82_07370 [Chitinophagaceae bacterium]|nr:hypothetical protein [Chitinophagaceae bacterium]
MLRLKQHKEYNYVVTLRKPSYTLVNAISQMMLLLAVAVFVYTNIKQTAFSEKWRHLIISGAIAIWWIFCLVSKRAVYFRLALTFAALGWILQPVSNYWMAVLYFIAAILEKQVKFPQEIGLDESGIVINSFPKKYIEWSEINNLLIHANLLTIDFKSNRLFQKELNEDISPALEKEFNFFCKQQIEKAGNTIDSVLFKME